jgi:ABC-type antimicrobial peptide transport system ATPase subunit
MCVCVCVARVVSVGSRLGVRIDYDARTCSTVPSKHVLTTHVANTFLPPG